jgi:hypothetical protein
MQSNFLWLSIKSKYSEKHFVLRDPQSYFHLKGVTSRSVSI